MKKLIPYSLLCIGVLSIASALATSSASQVHTTTGQLGVTSKTSNTSSTGNSKSTTTSSSSNTDTTSVAGDVVMSTLGAGAAAASTPIIVHWVKSSALESKADDDNASTAAQDGDDGTDFTNDLLDDAFRQHPYVEGQSEASVKSPASDAINQEGDNPDGDPLTNAGNNPANGDGQAAEAAETDINAANNAQGTGTNAGANAAGNAGGAAGDAGNAAGDAGNAAGDAGEGAQVAKLVASVAGDAGDG